MYNVRRRQESERLHTVEKLFSYHLSNATIFLRRLIFMPRLTARSRIGSMYDAIDESDLILIYVVEY